MNNEAAETPEMESAESPQEQAQEQDDGTEQGNVDPKIQAMYEAFATQVMEDIYQNPGMVQTIADKMKAMGPPIENAIGHTGAMMVMSVKEGLAKAGKSVPPEVIMLAGQDTVAELCSIAAAAGLAPEEGQDKLFAASLMQAVKVYGDAEIKSGKITPEMRNDAMQRIAEIKGENGMEQGNEQGAEQGAEQGPQPGGLIQQNMGM